MERAKNRFKATLYNAMNQLAGSGIRQLFVLLDEADNFVRAEMEEASGRRSAPRSAVSWFLRDLQTNTYPGRLRFIFAGYDQLGRVFRDPGLGESAFGNWGDVRPLNLGPLDRDAARALATEPLTALGMPVSKDIADRMLDYTSGHAILIQVFGRRLAEYVKEREADWPLNDLPIRFEHLIRIADDERGENNFRQLLEQTLGLNLDIARAYPLRFVFLALVTPGGVANGQFLGADPFTVVDTIEQVQGRPEDGWPELSDTLITDSLELLVQLGLLEHAPSDGRRGGGNIDSELGTTCQSCGHETVCGPISDRQPRTGRPAAADWRPSPVASGPWLMPSYTPSAARYRTVRRSSLGCHGAGGTTQPACSDPRWRTGPWSTGWLQASLTSRLTFKTGLQDRRLV